MTLDEKHIFGVCKQTTKPWGLCIKTSRNCLKSRINLWSQFRRFCTLPSIRFWSFNYIILRFSVLAKHRSLKTEVIRVLRNPSSSIHLILEQRIWPSDLFTWMWVPFVWSLGLVVASYNEDWFKWGKWASKEVNWVLNQRN